MIKKYSTLNQQFSGVANAYGKSFNQVEQVRGNSTSFGLLFCQIRIKSSVKFSFILVQQMDCRVRNLPSKRVFGRDITNVESRRPKNASISQKHVSMVQTRVKSRSFDKRAPLQQRDPITEYESDILAFMLSIQRKERQELLVHVTHEMRQILVDWLVDVHLSFQLREQTLHLALAYLNQYAATCEVTKSDYQLVGVACLWIASKYEEIYPPRMQTFIQVTDSSYSASELKAMEGRILLALNFNLNYTTSLQILKAVSDKWMKDGNKLTRDGYKTYCMCKYLLQLALFEGISKKYCMKTLVLSALMLSDSILKVKSDSKMLDNEKVEKETIMHCFKDLCIALQNSSKPNLKLRAIKRKYHDQKYAAVSRFRIEHR